MVACDLVSNHNFDFFCLNVYSTQDESLINVEPLSTFEHLEVITLRTSNNRPDSFFISCFRATSIVACIRKTAEMPKDDSTLGFILKAAQN